MRYVYSSLYHLRGLGSSPRDEEIFADSVQTTRAIITSNPVPLCTHLDRSCALVTMLIKGLIGDEKDSGTIEERLGQEVQRVLDERAKKYDPGVFLFFEAGARTPEITPQVQRDCGSFILALNGLPKGDIRARHEPLERKILAAIALGVGGVVGFEKVSGATVLFGDDEKAVYGFNFEGGLAEVLLCRRPSTEDLATTRQLAARIAGDEALERVVRLLNESMETDQEKLRAFLSAWMALEVFVNKNFGTYAERFWNNLSAGASATVRQRYLNRIHDVMKDKYKLLDKFVVISAELDPTEADGDILIFQR